MIPLVIAGHGTRDPAGVQEFLALVDQVRALLPGVTVEPGSVELTPPSIEAALETALALSDGRAVVVPLMVGEGGHVLEDIPGAIGRAKGTADVRYARHLGADPRLVAALEGRIAAARGDWAPERTTVVLVGRGCSVTGANADHVRLSRLVQEHGGYERVCPAFLQVAAPDLPRALDEAYAMGARRIVVGQNFLFSGRLRSWTFERAEAWRARHPDAEVRVAEVLGPCDELAAVVVDRYREEESRLHETSPAYLAGLLLMERDVLVVGGGTVSARRVPRLVEAGARVRLVSPEAVASLAALAEEGTIRWQRRRFEDADLDGAWYVLAQTDDPQVNAAVAAGAEARHTFCVRADDAGRGSAWTPAVARAEGFSVAVLGTGSPHRSMKVRDALLKVLGR
ncbi:sirohydrochlorin cobaltochelatase [Raineyella antarctica]|uniref:precorrin-2 dehydrogenase n=1 Tax=Raineyella antarctica TaxID=1577474 RepID=A0A1G6GDW9_9ACTN|nr:CbiX/SirB N-terminal domain-containing protein [Raineyella antarctica]SDB79935.1 sirohydrochlorin cobaltochelatase [Raineyella antarctica]